MLVEDVIKLSPLERFLYWIKERHNIYLKRKVGKPKPWTDDKILQTVFFTNPYRENDKTTEWFRKTVRDPLQNKPEVAFATVAFRWFNLIATGEILQSRGWLTDWKPKEVIKCLSERRAKKIPIFTGAFMVNSPGGEPKLEAITRRVSNVWRDREKLLQDISPEPPTRNDPGASCCMEYVHKRLMDYDGMGGFMAYEVVCDLRYTYLLRGAPDINTWSNPGPGAVRGLYRLLERDFPKGNNASSPPVPKDWEEKTQWLLREVNKNLPKSFPKFEAREVEMTLCETDKYERILFGDGRPKRKFQGV